MGVERFELGEGLLMTTTFAHFMAPFLMAFSPAEKGKPNPPPWSAVNDGINLDINVQLFVPSSFEKKRFFDRLNTVWWIAALIRLRGAFRAHVPIIADRPFAEIPDDWKNAKMLSIEVLPRHLAATEAIAELSLDDLEWIKEVWVSGGKLMHESSEFRDAFQALDGAGAMPTKAVALLAVWGALEHLFSPAKQELRFRVSANIAAFLEPSGKGRLALQKKVMKLYDARSSVAHGSGLNAPEEWLETLVLANRVLTKILDSGHVPTREDLENLLFAPLA